MLVLVVADGRSPTARRWVRMVAGMGHRVVLISTFPCPPVEGAEADLCMPVAFAGLAGSAASAGTGAGPHRSGAARKLVARFRSVFLAGRYRAGPITLKFYGPRFRNLVERMQPDLVHALRIPFEGMLATYTPPEVPLVVSIWGNDLTLHAAGSAQMGSLTRKTLARADALLADAGRDIRLAAGWGLDPQKPTRMVPGSGGIDLDEIRSALAAEPGAEEAAWLARLLPDQPLVINPRGFRTGSVRTDTFFEAVPRVLESRPEAVFACAAMAGQEEALRHVEHLHLQDRVWLLPHLPQAALWRLFGRAAVSVSVSQHDGTPNSLLEAMACGCFPVVGDLESLRDWITPGVNGLLVEPGDPGALADAILLALDNERLRRQAASLNARQVAERASAGLVKARVAELYNSLVAARNNSQNFTD